MPPKPYSPVPVPAPAGTTTSYSLVSSTNLSRLIHEQTLIHLLFHRNKNQHRSSKWFKHFSIFKRSLSKLIHLLQSLPSTSNTAQQAQTSSQHYSKTLKRRLKKEQKVLKSQSNHGDDKGGKKGSDVEERLQAQLKLFRELVIPNAYFAFTGLICSTQFGALGMVLLGILATVYRLIGGGELGAIGHGGDSGDSVLNDSEGEAEMNVRRMGLWDAGVEEDDLDGDLGVKVARHEKGGKEELGEKVERSSVVLVLQDNGGDDDYQGLDQILLRSREGGKNGVGNYAIEKEEEDGQETPMRAPIFREDPSLPSFSLSRSPISLLPSSEVGKNNEKKREKKRKGSIVSEEADSPNSTRTLPKKPPKKKKKKKRDEIDELFAGLV